MDIWALSYLLLLEIILQQILLHTHHLAHVHLLNQQISEYLPHPRLCSCPEITAISKSDRVPALEELTA